MDIHWEIALTFVSTNKKKKKNEEKHFFYICFTTSNIGKSFIIYKNKCDVKYITIYSCGSVVKVGESKFAILKKY